MSVESPIKLLLKLSLGPPWRTMALRFAYVGE